MTDTEPLRDWLVTFARKVAKERNYSMRHPGHVYTVMLRRDEAEGLLAQINELLGVPAALGPGDPLPDWKRAGLLRAQKAENDEHSFGL